MFFFFSTLSILDKTNTKHINQVVLFGTMQPNDTTIEEKKKKKSH